MTRVVFYTRRGCHLCEDAREALERAGIPYEEVEVDRDPALQAELGTLVPVVEVEGNLVFEAGMDPSDLPGLVAGGPA